MSDLEDLLDNNDIEESEWYPVKKELGKLKFWFLLTGGMLFLGAVVFGLLIFELLSVSWKYSRWQEQYLMGGFGITLILLFPLVYTHLAYAKQADTFLKKESGEALNNLLRSGANDWRVLTLVFILASGTILPILGWETYRAMQWEPINKEAIETYIENEPVEEEWAEPPQEDEWDETLEPLEEDPAPPSE